MKIDYCTEYDAKDVNQWSGLGFHIAKALDCQGNFLSYLQTTPQHKTIVDYGDKLIGKLSNKNVHVDRFFRNIKVLSESIEAQIGSDAELIFSPSSKIFAYLETALPKVFYVDATFGGMVDFYPSYFNLSKKSLREGHEIERKAIKAVDLAIYASEWAAQSAVEIYGADPQKILVAPFGANLTMEHSEVQIREILAGRSLEQLDLLFVGVDWIRKGGPKALAVTEFLNKSGLKTNLHVVGVKSLPSSADRSYLINYGFINKNNLSGSQILDNLYRKCHFFILPSVAEAFGVVFCEANAYGMPVISTRIGGIPTIVSDDENGKLFGIEASVPMIAEYLASFFNNPNYEKFCMSSFGAYLERLNWDVTGQRIQKSLLRLV